MPLHPGLCRHVCPLAVFDKDTQLAAPSPAPFQWASLLQLPLAQPCAAELSWYLRHSLLNNEISLPPSKAVTPPRALLNRAKFQWERGTRRVRYPDFYLICPGLKTMGAALQVQHTQQSLQNSSAASPRWEMSASPTQRHNSCATLAQKS